MRINQFVAHSSGLSRRRADILIQQGRIKVNGTQASLGQVVNDNDQVYLENKRLTLPTKSQTIMLNKPTGYVVSRRGQGSKTIYDLVPSSLHHLKPIGRLDKYSSGLLILTSDGQLANQVSHPSFTKIKVYEVTLDKSLSLSDKKQIEDGIKLHDGISSLAISGNNKNWTIMMHEGRNRQIRRTFEALGYSVIRLQRIGFGNSKLGNLKSGGWQFIDNSDIIS